MSHPLDIAQMGGALPCALWFLNRVDTEQHINGFGPFRAIVGGIE